MAFFSDCCISSTSIVVLSVICYFTPQCETYKKIHRSNNLASLLKFITMTIKSVLQSDVRYINLEDCM